MTKEEIMRSLEKIVAEIVEVDEVSLTPETTADDVPGWDSVAHVNILVAVEATFSVRFDASEISDLSSVGVLVDMVNSKLQAAASA